MNRNIPLHRRDPALRAPCPALALLCAAVLALPAAASAADAQSSCSYALAAQFPLRYTGASLEITVDGEIDGSPARLLVDTGASSSFLTWTGVERRKLPVRYTMQYVTGVGGNSKIANSRVRDMAVGPVHSGKMPLDVLTRTGYLPSYDAIIGAPFLLQADLEISLADKQLKMYSGAGCGDTFLAIWNEEAIEVPFERGYRKGATPRFKVKVNGHELDAIIDSGAGASVIELEAARRAGVNLDAPGVTRIRDTAGVGERQVQQWRAMFDTLSIGSETINKPELSIMDSQGHAGVDVLLGADFLRAHRVLFAMSQGKLYLAYLGGAVFPDRRQPEPWIGKEADAGNPDAQYVVARGSLNGPGRAKGIELLQKAADGGSPYASLQLGRMALHDHRYDAAALRFKAALDRLPSERSAALLLYLARQHTAEAGSAARELEASFAPSEGEWPTPIAEFYLGRTGADELLAQAGKKEHLARARTCEAKTFIAHWHGTHGDNAKAAAMELSARAECSAPTGKPSN